MNKLTVKPLPYAYDVLEPVISKRIMELHHDKHYVNYVNAFNAALDLGKVSSFNYNGAILHELFWDNMRPAKQDNQINKADGTLLELLEANFGSFEVFQKEFSTAAVTTPKARVGRCCGKRQWVWQ
jgi:Fe-Mn family superoxide dismutase